MPIKILMPALSPTMTEGNIVKWLKNEGDQVTPGEVIAEIETDKAIMELEAADKGVLGKIIVKQGTEHVLVNSLIALLIEEDEDQNVVDSFIIDNYQVNVIETIEVQKEESIKSNNLKIISDKSTRIFASPVAKNLATLNNINLSNIKGSGPYGRIIKQDVISYLMMYNDRDKIVKRDDDEYRLIPNNNIRNIIAKRLVESKQTIPHFYLTIECNTNKLLDVREDINKSFVKDSLKKISLNDFIILAVAKALKEVPEANASWDRSHIRYYNNIDISIAVSTNNGLITPVIKNVDQKNIMKLSCEVKELITRARQSKLMLEEFQGGNFTISNLGMYGIKNFNAIINPPQSCILAIGMSSQRTIVVHDQIKIATIMDVTLSSDHRVIDGVVGAQFLASFKKFIESPILILI